jgi:hypothetical protein
MPCKAVHVPVRGTLLKDWHPWDLLGEGLVTRVCCCVPFCCTTRPERSTAVSAEEHKANDRRIIEEGLNRKNLALLDGITATDVVAHSPTGAIQGLAAYKQYLEAISRRSPTCASPSQPSSPKGISPLCTGPHAARTKARWPAFPRPGNRRRPQASPLPAGRVAKPSKSGRISITFT